MKKGLSQYLALAAVPALALSAQAAPKAQKLADHVPGELIVKLRTEDTGMGALKAKALASSILARSLGAVRVAAVEPLQTDSSLQKVRLKSAGDVAGAVAALNQDPSVAYAEPNYIYRTSEAGLPNDTDFGKLWGLHNTGQTDAAGQVGKAGSDVRAVEVWKEGVTGSHDVKVAVIDTGVDFNHADLANNILKNEKEVAGNGLDDDGNGFIDDVYGWDFVNKRANGLDDHNHGTHCAGTIGGEGDNGKGVAGVNWKVRVLPVKFLSASGSGSLADAVEAINYSRIMGVHIMSNSWGGGGFSQAMKDSIVAAKNAGILFVAAAGNESNNNDASPTYPASYDVENVMAVAATDNQDKIASFSNYGARLVHVAAPGVKVYSTVKGGGYATYSGTSMATPHAAGVAALLLSVNPTWGYAELKQRLIATSDPVRALKRKVVAKGRLNAYNALKGIVPPNSGPDDSKWQTERRLVESDHPYKDHDNKTFTIQVPGAKFIRVIFDKIEVEARYDFVKVESASGEVVDEYSGTLGETTSEYVEGDTAVIRLKADESNTGFGFKVSRIQVITE